LESHSWRGILDTTLCDKACQWFSQDTPVSSTNKTDRHDITEILLKVALNTISHNITDIVTLYVNMLLKILQFCAGLLPEGTV